MARHDHIDHIDVASWTREQAAEAQACWEACPAWHRRGPPPILRYEIWTQELPALKASYEEQGGVLQLLEAIEACRWAHMPPPRWLARAAAELRERIVYGEYSTPRELFGLPGKPQPGKRDAEQRQAAALRALIAQLEGGASLTAAKFDVGSKHGVAPDTLRNLFYEHRRQLPVARHHTPDGWIETRTGDKAPAVRFQTQYRRNSVKDISDQAAETGHDGTEELGDAST